MTSRAPTASYLESAKSRYKQLEECDRKLVILDLNGTLCYRPKVASRASNAPLLREGLEEFKDYLFNNFHVMIWSSAQPFSVETMVSCKAAFTPQQQQALVATWARDTLRLTYGEYHSKVQTYKNLEWVWEDEKINRSKQFSQKDTIILDDSLEKIKKHPYNAIVVPEYGKEAFTRGNDQALRKVAEYLEDLRRCDNVSAFIYAHPVHFTGRRRRASIEQALERTAQAEVQEKPIDLDNQDNESAREVQRSAKSLPEDDDLVNAAQKLNLGKNR